MPKPTWSRRPAIGHVAAIAVAAVALDCLQPAAAHAYIDPGSGSFIIQGVIAAVLGAGVVIKMQWRRIMGKIRGQDDDGQGSAD